MFHFRTVTTSGSFCPRTVKIRIVKIIQNLKQGMKKSGDVQIHKSRFLSDCFMLASCSEQMVTDDLKTKTASLEGKYVCKEHLAALPWWIEDSEVPIFIPVFLYLLCTVDSQSPFQVKQLLILFSLTAEKGPVAVSQGR
jgi:hypothetical protein